MYKMKNVIVFDLDDTLTKEIDFLKSGYITIAQIIERRYGIPSDCIFHDLINWYYSRENAFECLNKKYNLDCPIEYYLEIYRFHKPNIKLSEEVRQTLEILKSLNIEFGIISDGRNETQMNKIEALGLKEWISEDCIIINSKREHFKPNAYGYLKLLNAIYLKNGNNKISFTYVGDNLKKDFIWPNINNWHTICLKDDGRNIHHQDFKNTTTNALPQKTISQFSELIKLYN